MSTEPRSFRSGLSECFFFEEDLGMAFRELESSGSDMDSSVDLSVSSDMELDLSASTVSPLTTVREGVLCFELSFRFFVTGAWESESSSEWERKKAELRS
jgi:hypothetical protein